jgi:ferrous iron transport protein B
MFKIKYEDPVNFSIEIALDKIESLLGESYRFSKRAIGLLLLQDDPEIQSIVKSKDPLTWETIQEIIHTTKKNYSHPLEYVIAVRRQSEAKEIADKVIKHKRAQNISFNEKISYLLMNPFTGIPVLLLVLYFGLYKLVGEFGAGVLVDFLEEKIFGEYINPFIAGVISKTIPWHIIQDLFTGEYGIITLGIRYAVAIILPVVGTFFLVFAVIEDTGYLPRLSMLIDRIFKKIGLSGRAVIPIVLGFGCDTMATMVTRTLPTKRERIIATLLLALAVPCSAQLGVILALLSGKPLALLIWGITITLVFLLIGFLTAKILPGERPSFYMEIPPLRFPKIKNVLMKTFSRVKWYLKEVLPIFILASILIWAGQLTKLFDILVNALKFPVKILSLPPETAKVFLYGFFRRDYGAAGLYDLNKEGLLTGNQLVVACVALTLFLPCIAQFLMNVKERGMKAGVGISVFVLIFSFTVAFILNLILQSLGVMV